MNFTDYLFENKKTSSNPLLIGEESVSYYEMYDRINNLAEFIYSRFGKGNEVLLLSDNNAFFITCYLAIIKSGNIAVLVETQIGDKDLQDILNRCSLRAFFFQEKYLGKLQEVPEDVYTESQVNKTANKKSSETQVPTEDSQTAVIIFTSGSTGKKKGVMLTHRNLRENTNSIIEYFRLTDKDRICIVLPLFYCFGASLLHTHIKVGGSIYLHNKPFLGSIIKEINEQGCTGFAGVPSTYQILINKTPFLKGNYPSLRYMAQAGGQLPNKFISLITESLPDKEFFVMYGATEATARLSYLPPSLVKKKMGSIGKGISGVTLEVLDENGKPVKPGETGEITAVGYNLMKGYYKDPEGTSMVLRDGRLYTGDLATIDSDGFIYIVGRSKNIIKSGGYRISPYEIEGVILDLGNILDCVVIGTPDDIMGEAVVAVVQSESEDEKILQDTIIEGCRKKLPSYKIPQKIFVFSEFPLNSSNKVDRNKIKEMIHNG